MIRRTLKFDTAQVFSRWKQAFPDYLCTGVRERIQASITIEVSQVGELHGYSSFSSLHRIDGGGFVNLRHFKTASEPNTHVCAAVETIAGEDTDVLLTEALYAIQGLAVSYASSTNPFESENGTRVAHYVSLVLDIGGQAMVTCKASERVSKLLVQKILRSSKNVFARISDSTDEIHSLVKLHRRLNRIAA